MRRAHLVVLAVGLALAAMTMPAKAQTTQSDLLVAGRALGFIDTLERGDVRVGIVYDPAMAQSAQQGAEINEMMAGGLRIGNFIFKPVIVPIGTVADAGVDVFFLTDGMGTGAASVSRASRARKIPCITFDLAEVRSGNCAIGVRSQPTIEVFVNQVAAKASGLVLAAVFRMMITGV